MGRQGWREVEVEVKTSPLYEPSPPQPRPLVTTMSKEWYENFHEKGVINHPKIPQIWQIAFKTQAALVGNEKNYVHRLFKETCPKRLLNLLGPYSAGKLSPAGRPVGDLHNSFRQGGVFFLWDHIDHHSIPHFGRNGSDAQLE